MASPHKDHQSRVVLRAIFTNLGGEALDLDGAKITGTVIIDDSDVGGFIVRR